MHVHSLELNAWYNRVIKLLNAFSIKVIKMWFPVDIVVVLRHWYEYFAFRWIWFKYTFLLSFLEFMIFRNYAKFMLIKQNTMEFDVFSQCWPKCKHLIVFLHINITPLTLIQNHIWNVQNIPWADRISVLNMSMQSVCGIRVNQNWKLAAGSCQVEPNSVHNFD